MLTEDQIRQFHTEGYLFLPETFSVEEVACLRADAEAIYAQERPEVWRERSGAPRTAFAAHLYNEGFGLLARHPAMIKPIEQLFGECQTDRSHAYQLKNELDRLGVFAKYENRFLDLFRTESES